MICLGIESTAHTFGIGIVDGKGNILANVKDTYIPPTGWGIEPIKAKEHHFLVAENILNEALAKAGIKKPDRIAVSSGPGLPPALLAGKKIAEDLGKRWNIPIFEVNHCIAHVEIARLISKFSDPVTLYVSGGNTQVIAFEGGRFRVFGETEDIGVGNLFDTFGRKAGLQFPAGPKMGELAIKGTKFIPLSYPIKGMDVTFSGILTKAQRLIGKEKIEDLCYSINETVFAMLVEVAERAMAHTGKNQLLLTGGVAASKRLKEMCEIMCRERKAHFCTIPNELAGDNGAMIAWAGTLLDEESKKLDVYPSWRTDEVDVTWKR